MTTYRVEYHGRRLPHTYETADAAELALHAPTPDDPDARVVVEDEGPPIALAWAAAVGYYRTRDRVLRILEEFPDRYRLPTTDPEE